MIFNKLRVYLIESNKNDPRAHLPCNSHLSEIDFYGYILPAFLLSFAARGFRHRYSATLKCIASSPGNI